MRTLEANQSQVCLLKANLGAGAPGERVAAQKPCREEGPAQPPPPIAAGSAYKWPGSCAPS